MQTQLGWIDPNLKLESEPLISKGYEAILQRRFDCVLCAHQLPDAGAQDLLRMLAEQGDPHPPVVVFGHDDDLELASALLSAGAQDYLARRDLSGSRLQRAIAFARAREVLRAELAVAPASVSNESTLGDREPLTELLNRRGLERTVARVLQGARVSRRSAAAVLVDFKNLRQLNQNFGLYVGDQLLLVIADVLRDLVGDQGEIAVIDGEYFVVVLPETTVDQASRVARRLQEELANVAIPLPAGTAQPQTTVKVARIPDKVETVHDLMDAVQLAEPDAFEEADIVAHQRVQGGLVAIDRLTSVLDSDDQLEVVQQVVMDLNQKEPFIYELFVRGRDELHDPGKLFAAARELDLETDLDLKCLELCLAQAPSFPPRSGLCFNVLPSTILGIDPHELAAACKRQAPNHLIIFDVSIRRITGNPSPLFRVLARLDKLGIPTSLDHVDISKSSMRAITLKKPRIVKTNPKMIIGIADDPVKRQDLQRLLAKVKSVGSELVALGLENDADMRAVVKLGVRFGQGFLLGRPDLVSRLGS